MSKGGTKAPVVTKTEARQGQRKGVIWILAGSLILAFFVGLAFLFYY